MSSEDDDDEVITGRKRRTVLTKKGKGRPTLEESSDEDIDLFQDDDSDEEEDEGFKFSPQRLEQAMVDLKGYTNPELKFTNKLKTWHDAKELVDKGGFKLQSPTNLISYLNKNSDHSLEFKCLVSAVAHMHCLAAKSINDNKMAQELFKNKEDKTNHLANKVSNLWVQDSFKKLRELKSVEENGNMHLAVLNCGLQFMTDCYVIDSTKKLTTLKEKQNIPWEGTANAIYDFSSSNNITSLSVAAGAAKIHFEDLHNPKPRAAAPAAAASVPVVMNVEDKIKQKRIERMQKQKELMRAGSAPAARPASFTRPSNSIPASAPSLYSARRTSGFSSMVGRAAAPPLNNSAARGDQSWTSKPPRSMMRNPTPVAPKNWGKPPQPNVDEPSLSNDKNKPPELQESGKSSKAWTPRGWNDAPVATPKERNLKRDSMPSARPNPAPVDTDPADARGRSSGIYGPSTTANTAGSAHDNQSGGVSGGYSRGRSERYDYSSSQKRGHEAYDGGNDMKRARQEPPPRNTEPMGEDGGMGRGRGRGRTLPAWMTNQNADGPASAGSESVVQPPSRAPPPSNSFPPRSSHYNEPPRHQSTPPPLDAAVSLQGTGRGRGRTMPAWMTRQGNDGPKGNDAPPSHFPQRDGGFNDPVQNTAQAFPPQNTGPAFAPQDALQGSGRGRGRTLPAWMTQGQQN